MDDGEYLALRFFLLPAGFLTMGLGMAMTIRARLGVSAWNVLHLGLSQHLPITVGQATQGVGLFIMACSALMGIKPRLGTWLNMVLVGACLDLLLSSGLVPVPTHLPARAALLLGGLAVLALGMCLYMCAGLGAGPRDGLMLALSRRFPGRVAVIRALMEFSALAVGYVLGGPVGVGTLLAALTLGWFLEGWFLTLYWARRYVPALYHLRVPPAIEAKLMKKSRWPVPGQGRATT
ncbi:MAG: hypothetical protein AB1445_04310 [Bacillota bacterium]